ncbi:MAG: DUF1732 domain-containing protein, partial [Deltaproteobacteria bacterium]|nr:DUF1732 domain-containing protein [Deltaproteobacteria bacterium]
LSIEEEIRKAIRQRISRGRVEVFIARSQLRGQGRRLELDERLLRQYLGSLRHAKSKFGLKGEVDVSLCASLPELFHVGEAEAGEDDEKALVLRTLNLALKQLERSREREGRQLKLDVQAQIRVLRTVSGKLTQAGERITSRLKDSLSLRDGGNFPDGPKETAEAAGPNFKGDIHEEVVRLKAHVEELARLIQERGPVGKKVDFLLQEIQRELNTISSKAPQLPVVQLVLAGKEKVEKIREQVQNLE